MMTSKPVEKQLGHGSDLEELIGSLGIDLYTPVKPNPRTHDNTTGGKGSVVESSDSLIYSSVKSFQNKLVSEGYGLNEDADEDGADTAAVSRSNSNINNNRNNLNSIQNVKSSTIEATTSVAINTSKVVDEPIDVTTLRYGNKVILRGCLGKYLSAHYTEKDETVSLTSSSSSVAGVAKATAAANGVFLLGVDGYGIDDTSSSGSGSSIIATDTSSSITDCLMFIPIDGESSGTGGNNSSITIKNSGDESDEKEESAVITYGSMVAIRAHGARERLLGIRESSKLGFWRNLVGQNEKWTILKASGNILGQNNTSFPSTAKTGLLEDVSSRGKGVHIGDNILLQAGPLLSRDQTATGILSLSEYILSLHEGADGTTARLINKDRLSLGTEHWLLESYHSQPIPPFLTNRPYLNGRYLLVSPEQRRINGMSLEKQFFPFAKQNSNNSSTPYSTAIGGVSNGSNQFKSRQTDTSDNMKDTSSPLHSQPQQIRCILRDLLLILSGVEGQFIRVVITSSSSGGNAENFRSQQPQNTLLKSTRLRDIVLAIQNDGGDGDAGSSNNIDRSIADQASTLFPLCQHVLLVREFIRRHCEYDFGLVSHALAAELRTLLREFELLVAQLEQLLLTNNDNNTSGGGGLTLQKLVFLLQPSTAIFRQLGDLCRKCDYTKGGELLNVLYTAVQEQGDAKMKRLFSKLFEKAFVPFRMILEHWLLRGDLRDTYHEFFIRENESVRRETLLQDFNAQYWEQRYSLVTRHVPVFMKAHALKTLVAGKYLNVVKGLPPSSSSSSSSLSVTAVVGGTRHGHNVSISPRVSPRGGSYGNTMSIGSLSVRGSNGNHNGGGGFWNNNPDSSNNHHHTRQRQQSIMRNTYEKYDDGDVDGNDDDIDEEEEGGGDYNANNQSNSSQQQQQQQLMVVEYDMQDHDKLSTSIETSYRYSSRTLLLVLEHQYFLSQHLTSLRRFFLFEHGDFFTQFMDIASEELCKSVKNIQLHRVQNLLQLAVQTSTLASDSHREGLTCTLEPHNLIQHLHLIQTAGQNIGATLPSHPPPQSQSLTGFESLVLDYRVQWPLSIVLSRRAITKYQLLSRILFYSKYVELRILGSWKDHQGTKSLSVRKEMSAYFCLRQRMLHFLQNFVYYMTVEVIKPRDHEMQVDMAHAQDMDEVLLLHEKFLDSCLKECLLASQEVLNVLSKILATCVLFADHVHNFMASFESISIPTSLSPVRQKRPTGNNNNRMSAASTITGSGVLKASNRRISIGSNNSGGSSKQTGAYNNDDEDDDAKQEELKLQHRARQTASDRVKRKLKQNMQTDFIVRESRQESFARYRNLFEEKFDKEVSEFLEKLWTDSYRSHPQLSNLCVRLDYNGYYSQKFVSDIVY